MSRKGDKQKKKEKQHYNKFDPIKDRILNPKELISYGKSSEKIKLVNSTHIIDATEVQLVDI